MVDLLWARNAAAVLLRHCAAWDGGMMRPRVIYVPRKRLWMIFVGALIGSYSGEGRLVMPALSHRPSPLSFHF